MTVNKRTTDKFPGHTLPKIKIKRIHVPLSLDHFKEERQPLDECCKVGPPPVHLVHGVETHVDTQAQQAESEHQKPSRAATV